MDKIACSRCVDRNNRVLRNTSRKKSYVFRIRVSMLLFNLTVNEKVRRTRNGRKPVAFYKDESRMSMPKCYGDSH
jgi:hypothetical protein